MDNNIYKFLVKVDRKYRKCRKLPFIVQNKTSELCPYSRINLGIIICTIDKKGYGCNPTPLCTFLLKS